MRQLKEMRVGIVGSGAIGGFYGASLARAGCDVAFLCRSNYDAVQANGWRVETPEGNWNIANPEVFNSSKSMGTCDVLIICVKSYANEELSQLIQPLIKKNTALITFQNGLGNVENLEKAFPSNPVFAGMCFITLNQLEPGLIRRFTAGRVDLGPESDLLHALADAFKEGGAEARVHPSLEEILWRKLCWNIPFNGLSVAAGGIPTDRILEQPALEELAVSLMSEIRAAAATQGIQIEEEFTDKMIRETKKMGAYRPSSLVDFQAGRPLEVESIWGESLRRGQAAGVQCPHLKSLYALLVSLSRESTQSKALA